MAGELSAHVHLPSPDTGDLANRGHRRFVWGMRKVYRGRDIEVSFDLDLCIHVAKCLRGEARVFQLNRRPWIRRAAPGVEDVAEVGGRGRGEAWLYHGLIAGRTRIRRDRPKSRRYA